MSPVETGGNRTLLPSIAGSTTSTNLANNGEPGQDSNFILIVILILSAIVIVVGIAIVSVLLYRKGGFRTGRNSPTDEEGENKEGEALRNVQQRSNPDQERVAAHSYEEIPVVENTDEDDTDMHDYDEAASTDIFNTMAGVREGPYVQPEIDEDADGEYLSPGQQVFEVERDRLHITACVHSGEFYSMHRGEAWFIGGKEGCTKIVIKSPTEDEESNLCLRREIDLMKSLYSHQNVNALLACCTKTDPPQLITEHARYGNLRYFLAQKCQVILSLGSVVMKKRLLSFCYDIAQGMEYLSSKQVVHRYLAANHILLCDGMVCKISNFGYSTDVIGDTQFFKMTNQFEISYQWMALESLLLRTFTTKSDVWSYGIALWEIFTLGQRPYFKDTQSEVLTKLNKGYRLLKPGYCEEELYRLMLACWKTKQESRPSFADIISSISQVSKIIPVKRASDDRDDKVSGKIRRPSLQRQFRVDHYIVRVTREVFRGKFSQIYLGKARIIDDESDSVQNVAVKVFTDESTEVSSLQREVDLMKSIPSNENVIGLLAYCTDEAPPFFVMEFARHGNLQRHLVENRPRFLTGDGMSSQRQILSFAKDIACGMEHLSNIGITHRYLTAKHVLVFTNTICKISSLGYVSDVTHGKRLLDMAKEVRHPYQWMALETLTNWTFDTYTDVWSFGVVLWEIVTLGKKPFDGFEQHEVLARLRKGYRLLKPSHCSDEVYDTMLSCWRKESNERPSFSKLVDVIKDHRERTDKLVDFTEYK